MASASSLAFVGINVTSGNQGNYYLDQKKSIEGVVKATKVSGCKVQKLPYPLEGPSLSKADNAKDEAEAKEGAKVPYRASIGMLSYIMGHTKPDLAYTLNALLRYCNNPENVTSSSCYVWLSIASIVKTTVLSFTHILDHTTL